MSRQDPTTVPFDDTEEAFFWFVGAMKAGNNGVQFKKGVGVYKRPCEPTDVMIILDRLRRERKLSMDHINVLHHYGVRMLPPDDRRIKEQRARMLWDEAMGILEEEFLRKGITTWDVKKYARIEQKERDSGK